jgi:hypothetical protein
MDRRSPSDRIAAPQGNDGMAYGEMIGLTRDELGYNDTDYHSGAESETVEGVE